MHGSKVTIARQLGIDPANVRVVSRYGRRRLRLEGTDRTHALDRDRGPAGSTARSSWCRRASRVSPSRPTGPRRGQRVQLGATRSGQLTALRHDGWEVTSRPSGYNVAGGDATARMYACPNIATSVRIVHADRATPGFMRAPPETPYMFGLESAMDELAYALGLDPIELRRINDTAVDPVEGRPFSSRSLMRCFDEAAGRFGWHRRNPKPASMRDGDWLVGYGCATACYPSNIGPAAAHIAVTPDGKALVQLAGHEIGTGAYTTVAVTVAHALSLPVENVTVEMGDSLLPPVIIAGGSNNAASTVHVAAKGCEMIRCVWPTRPSATPPVRCTAPTRRRSPSRTARCGHRTVARNRSTVRYAGSAIAWRSMSSTCRRACRPMRSRNCGRDS